MENKIQIIIATFLTLMFILIGLIAGLFLIIAEYEAQDVADTYRQKINESYDDGFKSGWSYHVIEIAEELYKTGWVELDLNETDTIWAFSVEECGQQVFAELQAEGCEVRCP